MFERLLTFVVGTLTLFICMNASFMIYIYMRIHDNLMRVVVASLQIQLLSSKDKGRPWPQFIHDFEVNCSKPAQVKMMILPLCQCKHIHFSSEKYFLAVI